MGEIRRTKTDINKRIMTIDINRKGLIFLILGSNPNYNEIDNPLVKKAGHKYYEQYGTSSWYNLNTLTNEELYKLYIICRNSWN